MWSSKLFALFSVIIFSLILVQSVLAYQYYLRPPRMVLYTNVTKNAPGTFKGFLEVRNNNNVTMNITFNTSDELRDITKIQYPFVILEPGEKMFWNFTGEVSKVGQYNGKISALYGVPQFQFVNLDSSIVVIATGQDVQKFSYKPVIAGVTAMVILGGSFLLLNKRKK